MTDIQDAARRARAFIDTCAEHDEIGDDTPIFDAADYDLTFGDLRTLIAAADPEPTLEWGVDFHFPNAAAKVPYKSEAEARAALPDYGAHSIIHRRVVRRADEVGEWIQGEPTPEAAG